MGPIGFQELVNNSTEFVGKGQKKVVHGQRIRPMVGEVGVLKQPLDQDGPVGLA